MSIKVKNLTKVFGTQKAIDNISFNVQEGEILGFLGPNGAGKSTTMKIATCYLPPDEGVVEVSGYDVVEQSMEVRKQIGYLPEHNPLYLEMYVREYLGFIGKLHGLKGAGLKGKVDEMVQLTGLTREQNKKIEALSKGYRQRVGLAQALIHDPKVLILDEPTTGLDPNQIIEIRNLIKNISRDKTVIFSTHIMQEVQALCDRVVVINKGKIVADDAIGQLKTSQTKVRIITAEFSENVETDRLKTIEGVLSVEAGANNKYIIKTDAATDARPAIFKFASDSGLTLLGLHQEEVTMENVFQELTRKEEGE
ncbi:gliding motility-associated ABC transporter ATP-binding subunit GldA [Fulvivirga kasyanovii]|uniref:Gliding motility-associated ABC transporter ATP-binding subunit GldA n=1 Tax=Fulvivirga kasyanovii TaxID=396812 RepID=A0ABW9RUM8_9BACT|nr:gliding motility-associated ABC transporter ATP-binding subunit GldA [Fulvivirga kasyanovii]MTI27929.1 gliding motility-associated ABC transporter ATP-binding subunit GldA [Fulvivirga kasyanovii]